MRQVVNRPPRSCPQAPERTSSTLAAPPAPPEKGAGMAVLPALLPALGGVGMLLFMVANRNPVFLVAGMVLVFAMVGGSVALIITSRTGARKAFVRARERYLEYLETVRATVRRAGDAQREYSRLAHPAPEDLISIAVSTRVYERRPADADFGLLRLGTGTVEHPVTLRVPAPSSPLQRTDPVCLRSMMAVASAHRWLTEETLTVPCGSDSSIVLRGRTREETLNLARSLLVQAAVWHSPADLRLAVASPRVEDFSFVQWFPHALDPAQLDGVVPRVWIGPTWADVAEEISAHLKERAEEDARGRRYGVANSRQDRLIVVLDEWDLGPTGTLRLPDTSQPLSDLGVCVVRLVRTATAEPDHVDTRVVLDHDGLQITSLADDVTLWGIPDPCPAATAEALARALAPRVASAEFRRDQPLLQDTPLESLLGLQDVALWEPEDGWVPRSRRAFLRVPIGTRADGDPLVLDLKESAFDGMGPHGLLVGATGSGKSELLRTLILALAATHPPEDLAFVLVDFKGGATFAGLQHLPHVAGVITNLADDLTLVDRMHDAMFGEINRRQQILHDHGNLPNLFAYESARRRDPDIPPLPHLLFVVDEFAELLTAKPDFNGLFTSIGRIGRSIGVHQLLASQRLDDGRLRGLESFLSYRLALRTFNADESRAVIGSPDAFELPSMPGSGYLKVDTTIFERFKSAYVSAPYRAHVATPVSASDEVQILGVGNGRPRHEGPTTTEPVEFDDTPEDPTVLDTLVGRMRGRREVVHQVWLPPLAPDLTLADVDAAHGRLTATPGSLVARVGIVDRPGQQTQHPFDLDLGGAHGHLGIFGGPQSGRSTALRTIVTALARTYPPGRVAVHAADLTGGSMRPLAVLPHVASASGRLDLAQIRRVFGELAVELDRRERVFAEQGLDSAADLRRRWDADGGVPGLDVCDIVLVVDGYATLKTDHDDLHDRFVSLVTRGLAFGLHVVTTAPRWFDLRPSLQTTIPGRFELRLNDPIDSNIDRRRNGDIPAGTPGRAMTEDGVFAQVALPVTGATATLAGLDPATAERESLAALAESIEAPAVARLRMLPTDLRLPDLVAAHPDARSHVTDPVHPSSPLLLGITEDDLGPVLFDAAGEDTHLLAVGDHGSGRTSLLTSLAQQIVDTGDDRTSVITLIDPRRTMLGLVPDDFLGAYATNAVSAAALAKNLAGDLARRQPEDTDPAALAHHTWRGPRVYFFVDDADHIFAADPGVLAPLVPFLGSGRDIGFHMILTHHAGGIANAMYQPVLRRLKELGGPTLLLSGDPAEGALWPKVTLTPQPPGRARLLRRGRPTRLVHLARP